MNLFLKSFLILLLLYKTNSITFEVVHYTVDNTLYGKEPLYLTIFAKSTILLEEINTLDLSIFDFISNCETKVTAISIEEDPYTKNDCQYYFRVNYITTLNKIKLPDKLIGNDEYTIIINKGLIGKEFTLDQNFNYQNNLRILLIEEIFNSEDSGNSFKLQIKVPFCKKIFADEGSKYEIANVNSIAEYNCTFHDIVGENYLNNIQLYSCYFKSGIKQIEINDINFEMSINDDDIYYFIKDKEIMQCEKEEEEEELPEPESESESESEPQPQPQPEPITIDFDDITPDNYFIYYSNERNGVFYIFYKIKDKINFKNIKFYAQLNKGELKDISSNCQPGLSRYFNYGQFTCSINLITVFETNKEYLINSAVHIYVSQTINNISSQKLYKTYIIKRGFEQPYYKDFTGSMNRNYTKNGEPI